VLPYNNGLQELGLNFIDYSVPTVFAFSLLFFTKSPLRVRRVPKALATGGKDDTRARHDKDEDDE
jgi:hypothetical protein